VTSEVDDEEEAKDHAKRERNRADEDSVDTNSKEGLDNSGNKLEETVDVFTRELKVLVGELALGILTLEVGDDMHDIEDKSSKKGKEEDPADETDDGEIVAEKNEEEGVNNAENKKRLHEILPHEDLLGLAKEFALLEGLADHVARAATRARRGSRLGLLLSRSFFLGFFSGGGFLDRSSGLFNLFFRHS
jgi:hypothetical protein